MVPRPGREKEKSRIKKAAAVLIALLTAFAAALVIWFLL
jgi:hypothetical protein